MRDACVNTMIQRRGFVGTEIIENNNNKEMMPTHGTFIGRFLLGLARVM